MEPMHYKILKILNRQPQQRISFSELKKRFSNVSDPVLRLIITERLGNNVAHSTHPDENNDFLIALSDDGNAAYHEKKYSDFINRRTLWINRIVSFILGVLTTVTAGVITWLITSGTLCQLLGLT